MSSPFNNEFELNCDVFHTFAHFGLNWLNRRIQTLQFAYFNIIERIDRHLFLCVNIESEESYPTVNQACKRFTAYFTYFTVGNGGCVRRKKSGKMTNKGKRANSKLSIKVLKI